MADFEPLAHGDLTADDSITCNAFVDSEEDGLWDQCTKPSRFVVERSDGDKSYGTCDGTEESCEEHLADAVSGMVDGDEGVRAVVTIRWNKGEAALPAFTEGAL